MFIINNLPVNDVFFNIQIRLFHVFPVDFRQFWEFKGRVNELGKWSWGMHKFMNSVAIGRVWKNIQMRINARASA
jgi:hypothetical protein